LDVYDYLDDLDPLKDAKIDIETVRQMQKDGYPKVETMDKILNEMTKIEDIGDVTAFVYGKYEKIEKIILKMLEGEKKETKEEKSAVAEEIHQKEMEEVIL
jgi:hypothetical protein